MNTTTPSSRFFITYLKITAIICGALVMVIEVLGSRVIGPFFGVSLYVWTSLIAVTLIALSLGYALGGIYADRRNNADTLFFIILLSGISVLVIPLIKGTVLTIAMPLGLRAGAFTSALILFGPSLFLLGCVSPYLIKITAKELHSIGRTVGGFYALSTFGSVLGTFITGFFLIVFLSVEKIFWITGLLLILLAIVYFIAFKRKWLTAISLILPILAIPSEETFSSQAPDGTRLERIFKKDSYYGQLSVVDYKYGHKHIREVMIDGLIQGGIDMTNMLSINDYQYFLQFIPMALNPNGKRCLVIGLGAGLIPRWYETQGVITDVVDIDPLIIDIAKKYFDFNPSGDTFASDARYFLSTTDRQYNYIILDVFTGDLTPGHLISQEAFELVSKRLKPNGILAMNLIGSVNKDNYMTASVIKTIHTVFKHVEIYPVFDAKEELDSTGGIGNLAVVAYNGEKLHSKFNNIDPSMIHPKLQKRVLNNIQQQYSFAKNQDAVVLTDDYNPIDFYDVALRETIRKNLVDYVNWDLLM